VSRTEIVDGGDDVMKWIFSVDRRRDLAGGDHVGQQLGFNRSAGVTVEPKCRSYG
jgi:hypothetical protein